MEGLFAEVWAGLREPWGRDGRGTSGLVTDGSTTTTGPRRARHGGSYENPSRAVGEGCCLQCGGERSPSPLSHLLLGGWGARATRTASVNLLRPRGEERRLGSYSRDAYGECLSL